MEAVIVSMNELQEILGSTATFKNNFGLIKKLFGEFSKLGTKLQEVRNKNMRHYQYVIVIDNLKHLFIVLESVKKSKKKQWISDGKVLHGD